MSEFTLAVRRRTHGISKWIVMQGAVTLPRRTVACASVGVSYRHLAQQLNSIVSLRPRST